MQLFKALCMTVLAGLVSTMAATAGAREIYVAPGGNNASSGSVEHPLQTLQKASDLASAGDIIRLRGGEYRGTTVLKRGGEPQKPITIEGVPGEQAVLKGSVLVSGWTSHSAGSWKVQNWASNSQQLFVDGKPLQQIGVKNRWHKEKLWANYVCLPPVGKDLSDLKPGSFFYDEGEKSLYCMLADGSDPNAHLIEAGSADSVLDSGGVSYVVVRNLSLMHSNNTAKNNREGVVRVSGSNWTIEDCRISYGDFGGLSLSGDNHIIRRCNISNNGAIGIDMNGSDEAHEWRWSSDRAPMDILIEDNELTGNNYRRFFDQWHAGAMKCVPSCRGVTIRRCRIIDNLGAGIWFDGGLGDNRIEDNLLVNNMTGIFYEISIPAKGDSFGALIKNNRVINGSRQGIYISASSGAIVENNTCYNNRWDIVVHGMPRKEFGGRSLENNRIRNNIVSAQPQIGIVLFTGADTANNILDGNFYAARPAGENGKGPVSITKAGYDTGVCKNPAEAFAKYGFEEHGAMGDPGWVDPANLDFHLKSGSEAAGKGWQDSAAAK